VYSCTACDVLSARDRTDPGKSWNENVQIYRRGKRHRSWKYIVPWNSKVLVVEILLSAPPLAGSPSSRWYDLNTVSHTIMFAVGKYKHLFGISVMTFEVSGCTKLKKFLGPPGWAYRPWKRIFESWQTWNLDFASTGKPCSNVSTNPGVWTRSIDEMILQFQHLDLKLKSSCT